MPARALLRLLTLFISIGCAGGEYHSSSAVPVVVDSAGLTIVLNERPTAPSAALMPATEPRLRIGNALGTAEYELYNANSAVRLSTGVIVVANTGTDELRFYTEAGTWIRTVGRHGSGPGEFRRLSRVWLLPGDSLLAYDLLGARISLFDADGRYVRSNRITTPSGAQGVVRALFDDRSLLIVETPRLIPPSSQPGYLRDSATYHRRGLDGARYDQIGRFPYADGYRVFAGDRLTMIEIPFGRSPAMSAAGSEFVYTSGEEFEFRIVRDGVPDMLVRLSGTHRAVTPADTERFLRRRLAAIRDADARHRFESLILKVPPTSRMPAFAQIERDPRGYIWVAEYRAHPEDRTTWRVFSTDGAYLFAVDTAAGFDVTQIGDDFLMGRLRSDEGIEEIVVYDLITR